nr:hypothetical protein CFP56_07849 [Quercus suber]
MATNPLPSPGVLSIHSRPADARRSSLVSSPDSSAAASEDDVTRLSVRPKLGSRKSSGTIIVERGAPTTVVDNYVDEGDVRSMSPRRNSAEVDRLGEAARQDLIAQAKTLQLSLQAIVERVEEIYWRTHEHITDHLVGVCKKGQGSQRKMIVVAAMTLAGSLRSRFYSIARYPRAQYSMVGFIGMRLPQHSAQASVPSPDSISSVQMLNRTARSAGIYSKYNSTMLSHSWHKRVKAQAVGIECSRPCNIYRIQGSPPVDSTSNSVHQDLVLNGNGPTEPRDLDNMILTVIAAQDDHGIAQLDGHPIREVSKDFLRMNTTRARECPLVQKCAHVRGCASYGRTLTYDPNSWAHCRSSARTLVEDGDHDTPACCEKVNPQPVSSATFPIIMNKAALQKRGYSTVFERHFDVTVPIDRTLFSYWPQS